MQNLPKRVELFHSIITSIITFEQNYFESISTLRTNINRQIQQLNSLIPNGKPFSPAISITFNYLEQKIQIHSKSMSQFTEDILVPLQKYMNEFKQNDLLIQLKQTEQELQLCGANTTKMKNKYNEHMKKIESFLYESEKEMFNNPSKAKKISLQKKNSQDKIAKTKEFENSYKESINTYNELINKYNTLNKKVDETEENFRYLEKELCFKYNTICLNMEIDALQNAKKYSDILGLIFANKYDKKEIVNNKETEVPITQSYKAISFEPYTPSLLYPKFERNEVNFFTLQLLQHYFDLRLESKIDLENERKEILFAKYCNTFIDNCNPLSPVEILDIKDLLTEIKYREQFICNLNKYKSLGQKFKTEQLFSILIDIINTIFELTDYNNVECYEGIQTLISISQTYYRLKDNGKKTFVEDSLRDNQLLSNVLFWEKYVENEIIKENLEHGLEKYDNKKQGPFCKIVSHIRNFVNFIKDQKKIIDLVNIFKEKFGIDNYEMKTILDEINKYYNK